MYMINSNVQIIQIIGVYYIIDLHDLHNHSFLTSLFLTEVHHYACAVNIPRLSHGCDDGIPRELPGDTILFSTVARDDRGSRRKRPSTVVFI